MQKIGLQRKEAFDQVMVESLKDSKMLKVGKDKKSIKRRLPFDLNRIDEKEVDQRTIYVEGYPVNLEHTEIAMIFQRAGEIANVMMPRFKDSKKLKGFAFIEYNSEEEAKRAISMFHNIIPQELTSLNELEF